VGAIGAGSAPCFSAPGSRLPVFVKVVKELLEAGNGSAPNFGSLGSGSAGSSLPALEMAHFPSLLFAPHTLNANGNVKLFSSFFFLRKKKETIV